MAQALSERDQALEDRALALADQAVGTGERWVQRLGDPPPTRARRERWISEVSTVAAYRDRWHITGPSVLGKHGDASSIEQTGQYQRARAAAQRAMGFSGAGANQQNSPSPEAEVELHQGAEL
jgi:hypothetical protein